MHTPTSFLAIGAALVDIVAPIEDGFLNFHGLEPGTMHLVDMPTSQALYGALGPSTETAGGSCANTAAIAALLGAEAHFLGKVSPDQLGAIFWHDMTASGVHVHKTVCTDTAFETGRCLSMVDASGQRSMATYLGAATQLTLDDAAAAGVLERTDWLFLEAYLLDTPNGLALVEGLCSFYQGNIALTLSDARCVERHHAFLTRIAPSLSLLLGNEEEMAAMFGGASPVVSLQRASAVVPRAVCTNGGNGVYVLENGIAHIPAVSTSVKDTTGAGDSFAGACMWALCSGKTLQEGAAVGVHVAAHIVSVVGARPQTDLTALLMPA